MTVLLRRLSRLNKIFSLEEANRFIEKNSNKVNNKYRAQYHVMAPTGWINDPNGFVFYKGEYHLFYQYYPYASEWGPMHWGHVKSKDLINWEELPVALAPDQTYDKDGCFSGSAIDHEGKLVLMYTGHAVENDNVIQTQCIAISDDGVTFTKVSQNPVISGDLLGKEGSINDFRDPKIFKREDTYYSVIATKTEDSRGKIVMFKSNDLIKWEFVSNLLEGDSSQGVMWECPDLFHLDGYDVLIMSPIQIKKLGLEYHNVSSTMACIGHVDWESGNLEVDNFHEIDFGFDFYAPQTLIDDKNRRIMIAWMQMWGRTLPTHDLGHNWAGTMTLPRELRVKDGRLIQKPISTVYAALEYQNGFENIEIKNKPVVFHNVIEDNTYIQFVCDLSQSEILEIEFAKGKSQSIRLNYNVKTELFTMNRESIGYDILGEEEQKLVERQVKVPLVNNKLILEVFRDTSSIELFINAQETMTATFYEIEKGQDITFKTSGKALIDSFETGRVKV